eukprot:jgi/Tetstr1/423549/TSEL_014222.t1
MTGGGIYASSGPSVLDEIVQPARSVYGGDTNAGTMQRGVRQQHSPSLAALRNASLLLIAGASLYDPEEVGVADVLVGGGKVLRIGSVSRAAVWELGGEVLDARGLLMLPGLVDLHSHIAGGGGELGPGSRTPEAGVSAIIDAGITTVVGVLGTDGVGRSLEELSAKANALADDGLRVFTWSGSYGCCPPLSITGSAARDVQLLSRVLGTGELAISDHRSSWPSAQELLRLAEEVRVAGMLAGKKGITHLHVGSASTGLAPLRLAVAASGGALPAEHLLPTHCSSRGPVLLAEAREWIERYGGRVDFTADGTGANDTLAAVLDWHAAPGGGGLLSRVSISTDAFGSFPEFDSDGKLVRYSASSPGSLLALLRALVLEHAWPLAEAVPLFTTNPAAALGLPHAGQLATRGPADLILLSGDGLQLQYVLAGGQLLKSAPDGWVKKGMFEV